ncbi:MAG TPA: hypothetical protein VFO19_00365 [Vicinamibacterales bacterium]|nr:hypothetical protein [Vicinamibacterales bacterium]
MTTRSLRIAAAYAVIAVAMTWPLARVIDREIAWDMGDPLFNAWVLMWTGGQVMRALGGDWSALHDFWNGNIFHPSGSTVAYSEHLTPQMLQSLPIVASTGNIVLAYNLLFLSTFVFAGLGTYVLVRDLTGKPAAAFLAGLAFAYAPYRVPQYSHLQVLSTFWMPLALVGFRRYFETGRTRALIGGATALVVQNLSCGYYLLYFPPFVLAYCLAEMAWRGRLRDLRLWRSLALAGIAVALATWPFVSPYLDLRRSRGDVGTRSLNEVAMFSADVHAFGTASGGSTLWGNVLSAYPRDEGEGFPGFTIVMLAIAGLGAGIVRAVRHAEPTRDSATQRRALVAGGATVAVLGTLAAVGMIGGAAVGAGAGTWFSTDAIFVALAIAAAATLALSPAARRIVQGVPGSAFGFFAVAALAAALLTLGPTIRSHGEALGTGPYYWLYAYVPGVDGLRVPARYLMILALFLAVLAGYGAAAAIDRFGRVGRVILALAGIAILAEGAALPFPTNVRVPAEGLAPTPRDLFQGRDVGPLYERIRTDPNPVVLIEFPFGSVSYEILAVFYAGQHRRPLVNGYSGFFPEDYARRATFLRHIPPDLESATTAVRSSGATHALVHEGAFVDGRGAEITEWLLDAGAREIARYGSDVLLKLR